MRDGAVLVVEAAAALTGRGIAFEGRITPPNLAVSADRDLMEQALINLLRNAADAAGAGVGAADAVSATAAAAADAVSAAGATGPGHGSVDVAQRGTPPRIEVSCGIEAGVCFIDVADNGPGLTAAEREQIFVPFFTTKPGGSGVGLSLARRIAAAHGGHLTVRPNGPRGSVFRLSLPVPSLQPVSDPGRAIP